ncbi:anti-sigma-D factor RsdA [Micromonospora sp. C28SCA-DRY-2]|uniref:anti-sigma-D factor RsdA n=1 Tax=Micromonospora sp. C28SCA-DRY-2 TaxID=3059522 RepID=UPI002676F872|nr:anti-sigma-D factor RsdA [Micromonospora sp. C28SCA-DRY-2]MDO3705034.1 anti-sigma-D factor RsdA [Micromonospora sp. C28SCA-DRY-2]
MTEQRPQGGDELDLATIARDDQLLDALGRGEPAPAGDDVAAMLAAWRADLDNADDEPVLRPAVQPPPAAPASRPAAFGQRVLRLAAAVVVLVAIATALGVASRTAGPSSPLWSLTKVLHPQQAQVRTVEDTIDRARVALSAGRLAEAAQLVEQARDDLAGVDDRALATRLRAELDALHRELLAALTPPPAPATAAPAPAPTDGGSAPPAAPGPVGSPPPASPPAAGEPDPPRVLPLPSLPTLLPSEGLPPLLPSLPGLPLPTGNPLG